MCGVKAQSIINGMAAWPGNGESHGGGGANGISAWQLMKSGINESENVWQ